MNNIKNKKTILVIEDEKSLLEVVKLKLEKNGFNVLISRSVVRAFGPPIVDSETGELTQSLVEQALKYLEDLEQIDGIWLDHNLLGQEDGLDFIIKFKANGGKWSTIPIFVVSNTSLPDVVKTYTNLGVNKYYVKTEHRLESIVEGIKSCV
ncbi:MAG: response regulator [bacterium]|nr:response regulator [bacterium]